MKEIGATPGLAKRELNLILKFAYTVCGLRWHKTMRPRHFTKAGGVKYRYTKRKGEGMARGSPYYRRSTAGRKRRIHKHEDPLVWSGASRTLSEIRVIRATSRALRVPIRAPALNFKPRKSRVNMRAEMEAVSPDEVRELVELFDRTLEIKLRRFRGTRTTRI